MRTVHLAWIIALAMLFMSTSGFARDTSEHDPSGDFKGIPAEDGEKKTKDTEKPGGSGFVWGENDHRHFLISTGITSLDPYKIDPTTHLISSATDTRYYVELEGRHRLAWAHTNVPFDGSLRLGYTFGDKNSDAVTVIGTGDAYLDASAGWPFRFVCKKAKDDPNKAQDDERIRLRWKCPYDMADEDVEHFTVGPEINALFLTDRGFLDIHANVFLGLALAGSIGDGTPIELLFRGGTAFMDVPRQDSQGRVLFNSHNVPEYRNRWTSYAIQGQMRLPIERFVENGAGYITLESAFYGKIDPNPWLVRIAYSFPLGVTKDVLPKLITDILPKKEKMKEDK